MSRICKTFVLTNVFLIDEEITKFAKQYYLKIMSASLSTTRDEDDLNGVTVTYIVVAIFEEDLESIDQIRETGTFEERLERRNNGVYV